jgi:hypothetical protein
MKRYITLFVLLLIWAVTASAVIAPIRISVATNTPSTTGEVTIDVLSSSGGTLGISITKTVTSDESGILSFVLDVADLTGVTYVKDNLVRVIFGGVVLCIERMEVIYAKQGLFGAMIEPAEISGGTIGQVLTKNASNISEWQNAGNDTYAYCYDNVGGTLSADTDISLNSNGPMSNITHTPGATGITIATSGVYKIDYGINIIDGIGAALVITIDGTIEESSRIYFVSAIQNYNSSVILSLVSGNVIKLRNASAVVVDRPVIGVTTHIVITTIN